MTQHMKDPDSRKPRLAGPTTKRGRPPTPLEPAPLDISLVTDRGARPAFPYRCRCGWGCDTVVQAVVHCRQTHTIWPTAPAIVRRAA